MKTHNCDIKNCNEICHNPERKVQVLLENKRGKIFDLIQKDLDICDNCYEDLLDKKVIIERNNEYVIE